MFCNGLSFKSRHRRLKIEDFWESRLAGIFDLGVGGLKRLEVPVGSLKMEDLRDNLGGILNSATNGLKWLEA